MLLPVITRQGSTAAMLMEMVKKEKEDAERARLEEEASDDAERARSPGYRPLTDASSHSRLATPHVEIPGGGESIQPEHPDPKEPATLPNMSDSPSPEKLSSQRITDSPVSALPSRGAAATADFSKEEGFLDGFESISLNLPVTDDEVGSQGEGVEAKFESLLPAQHGVTASISSEDLDGQMGAGVEVLY